MNKVMAAIMIIGSLTMLGQNIVLGSDEWWQDLNIVSTEWGFSEEMGDLINVIGWGSHTENAQQQAWTAFMASKFKSRGDKYIGFISIDDAHDQKIYQERPELADAAVIDIHGNPVIVDWESIPENQLFWENTNDQRWKNFLFEQARNLVDAGVDGIILDEPNGSAGSIFAGGSFGEPDMTLFRAYIRSIYSDQELIDQFGIFDPSTFDYGDYIRGHNLSEIWINSPWEVPFFNEFLEFQELETKKLMEELISTTRSYAKTVYDREISFSANVAELQGHFIIYADLLDYYTVEFNYKGDGYPPKSQAIPFYKLARALGDKPMLSIPMTYTNADLMTRGSTANLMTIYTAEAYASRGMAFVPNGITGLNEGSGGVVIPYWGDMTALAPVYSFIKYHPYLYKDLENISQVAIMFSSPSNYFYPSHCRDTFRGLGYALLEGQVQFDVVFMGDNYWLPDSFDSDSLKPYKLVFLPDIKCLTQNQVELLLSFVFNGGTVVSWGQTGRYDERNHSIDRPDLTELTATGTHSYGAGWFIALSEDPGKEYLKVHNATIRQQFVSLVNDYANSITTATAGNKLSVLTYERFDSTQMVTHLINNDYNIDTDQVKPTGPFNLTIQASSKFLSQDDIQLYLLSPHRSDPALLNFTVHGGVLSIDHPGVNIYDVIIAMPEKDAFGIANVKLDTLKKEIFRAQMDGYDLSSIAGLMAEIEKANDSKNYLLSGELGEKALKSVKKLIRPKILFDESHQERNTIVSLEKARSLFPSHPEAASFMDLKSKLDDDFIVESYETGTLSSSILQNYDVLVLSAPEKNLSPSEVIDILSFVSNGGGLVFLGDAVLNEDINTLLRHFGIEFNSTAVFEEEVPGPEWWLGANFYVTDFLSHDSLGSNQSIKISMGSGGSFTVSPPAVAIGYAGKWLDENMNGLFDNGEPKGPFPVFSATEYGQGKVFCFSDNSFADAYSNDDIFFIHALNWLIETLKIDIKANGSDNIILVSEGIPVSISVSLGQGKGQLADWWLLELTPESRWNYFDLNTMSLRAGVAATYKGPLNDVDEFILNLKDLSLGTHTFYFAVDLNMNGILDSEKVYYDSVTVDIQ